MKWLNALAMVLQFASFWLVAPEIIGEKTLSRISLALKKMISNLSLIFMVMLIAFYAIFFAARGIITGMEASQSNITQSEMNKYYIQVSISTVFYAVFMVFYKKIRKWVDTKISTPLVEKYIIDDRLRKNSLITGAFLFTAGFLIQFILIFATP